MTTPAATPAPTTPAVQLDLRAGDSRVVLAEYPDNHFDSVVTDPPYELKFMGAAWDQQGVTFEVAFWAGVLRVLKPGGHLLAFGGTRTYHRMTCAIEDAGFEIRDSIHWVFGSGFPKSMDVSKALDKTAGAKREVVGSKVGLPGYSLAAGKGRSTLNSANDGSLNDSARECEATAPATEDAKTWAGWGTALKPAHEPIVLARKPLGEKTVAANVLKWGTGALNIDGCRIGTTKDVPASPSRSKGRVLCGSVDGSLRKETGEEDGHNPNVGRFPANLIHDGSLPVQEGFAAFGERPSGTFGINDADESRTDRSQYRTRPTPGTTRRLGDTGSAARFFNECQPDPELDYMPFHYCPKASKSDRGVGNVHPTVKPLALIRHLVRLITPPGGRVLDPFLGSGTTALACLREGFHCVGVEAHEPFLAIAAARVQAAGGQTQTPGQLAG